MVSGSFSLPLPGVLFTFPSQYYALSVTKEYLALRGGPRVFSQGSTCLDLLWIPPCQLAFRLRGFHPSLAGFPKTVLLSSLNQFRGPNPRVHAPWFGLFRFRSPLLTESHVVFSSSGYLDVSVHRVPFPELWIGSGTTEVFLSQVSLIRRSPDRWVFAPPRSFSQLITSFIGS